MPIQYNVERGEVPLVVGGTDLVIAAEIKRLATLSTKLGCQSFYDLYSRLANVEVAATIAAVETLSVRGDVSTAVDRMTIADLPACKDAFAAALLHHAGKSGGNAEAAKTSQ